MLIAKCRLNVIAIYHRSLLIHLKRALGRCPFRRNPFICCLKLPVETL